MKPSFPDIHCPEFISATSVIPGHPVLTLIASCVTWHCHLPLHSSFSFTKPLSSRWAATLFDKMGQNRPRQSDTQPSSWGWNVGAGTGPFAVWPWEATKPLQGLLCSSVKEGSKSAPLGGHMEWKKSVWHSADIPRILTIIIIWFQVLSTVPCTLSITIRWLFEKNRRVTLQSQDSKSTFPSIVQLFPHCILSDMKSIPEFQMRKSRTEPFNPDGTHSSQAPVFPHQHCCSRVDRGGLWPIPHPLLPPCGHVRSGYTNFALGIG